MRHTQFPRLLVALCLLAPTLALAESIVVTVSPSTAGVVVGSTRQFTATVTNTLNTAVTWTVNGSSGNAIVGTISASGLYAAPATVPSPALVTVQATSQQDMTKAGSASVQISSTSGDGTAIKVTVSPSSASVIPATTKQFTAAVLNTMNTAVTWSVNGLAPGNATIGTIDSTGLFTAPAAVPNPSTVTVRATSVADITKYGSASVTIGNAPPPPPPTTPGISMVSPQPVPIGAFSITVVGSGFGAGSQITLGGQALATTYVSASQLTATGTAAQVQGGIVSLTVSNPGPLVSAPFQVAVGSGPQLVTAAAASRFLEQAAFGPSNASVAHVQQAGLQGYLSEQFALPPVSNYRVAGGGFINSMGTRFITNAVNGPDQLRQRVAFALSQIFVVSLDKLNWSSEVIPYEEMLMADAFGNYKQIMTDVTLHPSMGVYLDMVNNDKATSATGVQPNENYAREIMQLFTLGTSMLNIDGTAQLDAAGNPVPTYNQKNITELARVFTGWTFAPAPGHITSGHNNYNTSAPMVFYQANHDIGSKTLLNGKVLPGGQMADQDMANALQNIFDHPNMGPFVARQLIVHLVMSNPGPAYIQRVAMAFNDNGQGVRGDMRAVITAVLLDPEARQGDSGSALPAEGHLQEPALFLSGFLRAFNAYVDDTNYFSWDLLNMGQDLFRSPSVFNYFSPSYQPQGVNLFGPELQIHTPYSALYRSNFVNNLFNSYSNPVVTSGPGTKMELTYYVNLGSNPAALVAALDTALTHGQMPGTMKQAIVNAVTATTDTPGLTNLRRVEVGIYLIVTSSFYQVWH